MSEESLQIRVPDIGDFEGVEVIEVAIAPGDSVQTDDTVITLESDKASMDVPADQAGTVQAVHVKVGDKVSDGDLIATLSAAEQAAAAPASTPASRPVHATAAPATTAGPTDLTAEVVVLGAGPGGYTAAFRAADLGKNTILVERYPTLGGVCLNVGCIPSKALLHTAEVIEETRAMAKHGVVFGAPQLDIEKLRGWKDSVVGRLTKGLAGLAKQRKVQTVQGHGRFLDAHILEVDTESGTVRIGFENAVIAAGSQATQIPSFPNDDPRLMDSTDALALDEIPGRMLIIGGGIIGLEMAAVYHALGARVTVVELLDSLIPGCDPDLVRPLQKLIEKKYERIVLGTKVTGITAQTDGLEVSLDGPKGTETQSFDRILVAVGRRPNGGRIGADKAGVHVDEHGFIPVDKQQRTNVAHIFAIGDIVGQPMLAHKATHEGKVAAEVCAGLKSAFDAATIPSVAYTDPEVAWSGMSEAELKAQNIAYDKGVFPWAASGRSLGMGRSEGITKLLFDKDTGRLIGAGIVGNHAGDLIAEATLAIEMGADAEDLGLTIHPHPTLSETVNFAAEMVTGTITDLYVPKRS